MLSNDRQETMSVYFAMCAYMGCAYIGVVCLSPGLHDQYLDEVSVMVVKCSS